MRGLSAVLAVAAMAGLCQEAAFAQAPAHQATGSDLLNAVTACRGIGDAAQRLACYDEAATRLTQAVGRNDVVVLDREDIRQTRRSLFGFHLPRLPFLGGGAREVAETPDEITATVSAASNIGYDKYRIRLEDGAVWQTTEASPSVTPPHAGSSVVIRRGAMGNYFMRIDGQRSLRAMRTG
jgi:hypothetical protein